MQAKDYVGTIRNEYGGKKHLGAKEAEFDIIAILQIVLNNGLKHFP